MIVTDLVTLFVVLLTLSAIWGRMMCKVDGIFDLVGMVVLTGYISYWAHYLIGQIGIMQTAYNLAFPIP